MNTMEKDQNNGLFFGRIISQTSESVFWTLVSFVVSGRAILTFIIFGPRGILYETLPNFYFDILLGLATFLFPIAFKLIYGCLPLTYLGKQIEYKKSRPNRTEAPSEEVDKQPNNYIQATGDIAMVDEKGVKLPTSKIHYINLLTTLSTSSRLIADDIYRRSRLYLLFGVLIAFLGLIFFYLQTNTGATQDAITNTIITLTPKFGVLFFIELIAFFFLKQYRSSMDEFRYYESIKRHREETLVLLSISSANDERIDPLELVKNSCFYSTAGRLSKDETTELLESKKLDKGELEILGKILDIVIKK